MDLGLRLREGHEHGGLTDATACSAAERKNDRVRAYGRARAQTRLPVEARQQLLNAIWAGQPFRTALQDLCLTPNQVWGLTQTDEEWSAVLETALMATRRDDLKHGTVAAYTAASVRTVGRSGWPGTANASSLKCKFRHVVGLAF
jgi:hypothetical protein